MGKKVRMKWRKLDVVQSEERDDQKEVLDNENPFLKVHLLDIEYSVFCFRVQSTY